MTFEIIQGNLFDPEHRFTAIAQGVNCQGIMGAGIAVRFRNEYPKMYQEYVELCSKDRHLLPGTAEIHLLDAKDVRPDVINLFTQFNPGKNGDYGYVERSLHSMKRQMDLVNAALDNYDPWKVGLPWVGCGIAGLERHNVEHIMRRQLEDSEHEFVLVQQEEIQPVQSYVK